MMAVEVFPFAFDARFAAVLRLLGVTRGNAMVTVTDHAIVVQFGRWRLRTPLLNVECVERTGGYRWWKAIGVRASFVDHGITFGTNTADERGNVMAHVGYTRQEAVWSRDRRRSAVDQISAAAATGDPEDGFFEVIRPFYSSFAPPGRFFTAGDPVPGADGGHVVVRPAAKTPAAKGA